VDSYFAMRKFSVERDDAGDMRLFLNGAPYFQNGVLESGRLERRTAHRAERRGARLRLELAKSMASTCCAST
jgi:hypothetical protein